MLKFWNSNLVSLVSIVAFSILIAYSASVHGETTGITMFLQTRLAFAGDIVSSLFAVALVAMPGMIFSTVLDNGYQDFRSWIGRSWLISLGLLSVIPISVTYLTGQPVVGQTFIAIAFALGGIGLLLARQRQVSFRWIVAENRFAVAVGLVLPVLVLFLLATKFFVEELNGDGTHVYVTTRSLIHMLFPLSPDSYGSLQLYPFEVVAEIFNTAPFVRIFPDSPLAIRLSFIWGLLLLFPFLISLISDAGKVSIRPFSKAAIITALLAYVVFLAYQTSYNPYFADIAIPGAREPFVVLGFLAYVHFFGLRQTGHTLLFIVLLSFSTPGAPILMLAFLLAEILLRRPIPKIWILNNFLIIILVAASIRLLPGFIDNLIGTESIKEFGSTSIFRRLRYLTFFSTDRLLYWVLPSGILPVLSIFLWRRMDQISQELLIVSWAYTLFFLFQAYRILPHHFAPVILISLVVFWRTIERERSFGWVSIPGFIGAGIGLFLSFPVTWDVHVAGAELASRIAWHLDYKAMPYEQKLKIAIPLTTSAFAMDYALTKGQKSYVVSPLAIASQASQLSEVNSKDYLVLPLGVEPDPDFPEILLSSDQASLAVRDRAVFLADKSQTDVVHSLGNRFFNVPRWEIFGVQQDDTRFVIDWVKLIGLR